MYISIAAVFPEHPYLGWHHPRRQEKKAEEAREPRISEDTPDGLEIELHYAGAEEDPAPAC